MSQGNGLWGLNSAGGSERRPAASALVPTEPAAGSAPSFPEDSHWATSFYTWAFVLVSSSLTGRWPQASRLALTSSLMLLCWMVWCPPRFLFRSAGCGPQLSGTLPADSSTGIAPLKTAASPRPWPLSWATSMTDAGMQGPGPLSATWAPLDLPASLWAEASIKAVSRPNFFCPVLFAYLPSLSQLLSPVINLLYANLHLRVGFLVSPTCDTFLVPSLWDSPPSS